MKRKRCILGFLLIGMIFLIGCGEESEMQMKQIDQKILFIYRDYCFGENGASNKGYFIDNQGRRVDFDLSDEGFEYAGLDKVYEYLLDTYNSRDVFMSVLSPEELQECYDWLYQINMENPLEVKVPEKNELFFFCWYGVIENGEESPQFVVLLEKGPDTVWKRKNSDEYTEKILKRLLSD